MTNDDLMGDVRTGQAAANDFAKTPEGIEQERRMEFGRKMAAAFAGMDWFEVLEFCVTQSMSPKFALDASRGEIAITRKFERELLYGLGIEDRR